MNQLITYNNSNDGDTSRRFTGFPLNSTLVSSYTPDTIRTIINHAITGKPYTTAVWIRINNVGIQISAQDPQIARTRIPVFIPIGLAHDIFMQPNINNVVCIVYEEVKSNMKGVLLYVVHPTDAHLLRDDFRLAKQSSYSKSIENQIIVDKYITDNNRLFSPTSQKQFNEIYLNVKTNRQQSPRRILYVRDNDIGLNGESTPSSIPISLPQLSYAPFKGSFHSSRENSRNRRHKSPKKNKTGHSSNKTASDNGSKDRRKYRSRSPKRQIESQLPDASGSVGLQQEHPNQEQEQQLLLQQEQQIAAWQAAQQMPMVPMGVYNRYVPKAIPLPTGETIKTTLPSENTNGLVMAHIEPQQNDTVKNLICTSSRSRSVSLKRQDSRTQYRPLSAHNADASANLTQPSHNHHHHHHHHHHRRHQTNGFKSSLSKADSNIYNTISHSFRTRSNYISKTNNMKNNDNHHTDDEDNQTKQYLKQLIEDMHTMKLEMNKLRVASSSTGTAKGRSDSLRINLKELRNDIDAICARMAMASKVSKQ
ncbi:unnamed protein product [Rotaria sordida]|uniref:Uncharacterized protein n=2 Tax=Rotaria sordida TaxID=392033 RepID=A0A818Y780_9BILA|nr:unnamed protein product [Rotaria sordida]CAF1366662.1 unnamed protein product [Rotaria sordida]CAF3630804.1 unnamed protein product [Rotaria sordida]CAF3749647.1 unnamed protein product [Rotaria sordida]